MSEPQLAVWESVHARVRVFLEEAREVDGGAKLAGAEADVAQLERLAIPQRDHVAPSLLTPRAGELLARDAARSEDVADDLVDLGERHAEHHLVGVAIAATFAGPLLGLFFAGR